MATFVIVHGGFGGGWEWSPVARLLRGLGHEVYTPTLTGMGERTHLASTQVVGLSTHVQDVVGLLEFENLHDVVLCGAGFGGMAVTCAADRVAHRVGLVMYVDALVPHDRESALDLLPPEFSDFVRSSLAEYGETWRIPTMVDPVPPGSFSRIEEPAYIARLRDHPVMTLVEPIYLTGAIDHLPRAFVRCIREEPLDEHDVDPIEAIAMRAHDAGWHYRELMAPHDPHLSHPNATARLMADLAVNVRDKLPSSFAHFPTQPSRGRRWDTQNWAWSPN
ncbi:MAG: alpha/beta hydrolase [Nocardioidaceae bacterium]